MLLVNPRSNVLTALLEYLDLFQSKCKHKTNILEGLSCLLPFCITAFHIKHNYYSYLSVFCYNLRLLYQHFALWFPIFKAVNCFFAPGAYTSSNIVTLRSEHTKLSNCRFDVTFCHPQSVPIVQYMQRFFSKPR